MDERFEIKAVIHPADLTTLKKWMVLSEHAFKRSYPNRIINNIYYDTACHNIMKENLSGVSQRHKVRFRWYDNPQKQSPFFIEYKIKNARLGKKERYDTELIPDDKICLQHAAQTACHSVPFDRSRLAQEFRFPTIRNRYEREYFESMDGQIRLTLDKGHKFSHILSTRELLAKTIPHQHSPYILEFKFLSANYKEASHMLRRLPFRVSRHSKYLLAACSVYRVPYL